MKQHKQGRRFPHKFGELHEQHLPNLVPMCSDASYSANSAVNLLTYTENIGDPYSTPPDPTTHVTLVDLFGSNPRDQRHDFQPAQ